MDDRLVLLQPKTLQHSVQLVGPEDAHQVVFQRQEELRMPGVALPPGAPAQLVVDATALVPLGAQHVEAAGAERLLLEPPHLLADLRRPAVVLAALVADLLELLLD